MPTTDDRLEELITLAKIISQGLSVQQDGLMAMNDRLIAIEDEALKDLVGAVNDLHDLMVPVAYAILGEPIEEGEEP